jgi:hypothetical protein
MMAEKMDFSEALKLVKAGRSVRRAFWAPRFWSIRLVVPGRAATLTYPFIVKDAPDGCVPWTPTHSDLLATDWETT